MNNLSNRLAEQSPSLVPESLTKDQDSSHPLTNIALVDELPLFRGGLSQALLQSLGQGVAIHPFPTIEEAVSSIGTETQLIVLFSHHKTEQLTRDAIKAIASHSVPILVVSDEKLSDLVPFFREVLQFGICGFVSTVESEFKMMPAAISFAATGGTFVPKEFYAQASAQHKEPRKAGKTIDRLTARQAEVFQLLRQGKPNKLIAHELQMSQSTVKVHVRAIMQTIGATNRTQAVFKGEQPHRSIA
ncbi:response regulator transcription factor [Acidisoma cellulosilytica]|uniref:Response regulator transcription factor n=1 Tax=Acidisoma cellulosilyticum TaxID=2802395 RepID=A0A964E575_9PROT|nr:response regulator transcription factor [Acidisoma cellulosilyticum]MCB8882209.1 response regulator transcription factor [Acidisoma cellulosilyticum]